MTHAPPGAGREEWSMETPAQVLALLSESEINRQTFVHKLISDEEQYIQDLDIVEFTFIQPLRLSSPPVIALSVLEDFIEEVLGNILEIREYHLRVLKAMYVRQRDQHPVIQSVGNIFLDGAMDFRNVYPTYLGHYPLAEKRLKEELEQNPDFELFIEKCLRQLSARLEGSPCLGLKQYLNRPAENLQNYRVLLDAVYRQTGVSNPDGDYLLEAIAAIQSLL